MSHRREQFTILGASGLIGRNLCARLSASGHDVLGLRRDEPLPRTPLGHVIYAIGLTADFRQRPFETMAAHVTCLSDVMQHAEFRSFLYLSSTRVYGTSSLTNEDALITCSPGDPDHLYNLSKLAGESLTLHCGRRNARVARLSNVVNPDCDSPNFLDSIIRDAVEHRRVVLNSHPQSSKDYVWLDDVVTILPQIAMNGAHSMYNVAGGMAVTHCEWLDALVKHTGCAIGVAKNDCPMRMAAVRIDRARHEFGFEPRPVLAELPDVLANLKEATMRGVMTIDLDRGMVEVKSDGRSSAHAFSTPEAFDLISQAWLRCGWDCKHVYSFTWLGRPIVQLPEDMFRLQEVIHRVQPDVIVDIGVAHGGSLVFHAGLCRVIGRGRVIGVDIEIRPHNRAAIESHPLASMITLIEGSSIDHSVVEAVRTLIAPGESVMVLLDGCHTRDHVRQELELYSPLVTKGSYIVAMDGIMEQMAGVPRTRPDWSWNNPKRAAEEFAGNHPKFVIEAPPPAFNEGTVRNPVTYWPSGYLRRIS